MPFVPPAAPETTSDRSAHVGSSPVAGIQDVDRFLWDERLGKTCFIPFVPDRPPRD